MTLPELLDALGIDPSVVAAGTSGGILRALSRQRFKIREAIVAPICGALAAAYLTTSVAHYGRSIGIPMPDDVMTAQNAAAFMIGVIAMWITDMAAGVVVRWFKGQKEE